jgi:hypothetical protein
MCFLLMSSLNTRSSCSAKCSSLHTKCVDWWRSCYVWPNTCLHCYNALLTDTLEWQQVVLIHTECVSAVHRHLHHAMDWALLASYILYGKSQLLLLQVLTLIMLSSLGTSASLAHVHAYSTVQTSANTRGVAVYILAETVAYVGVVL